MKNPSTSGRILLACCTLLLYGISAVPATASGSPPVEVTRARAAEFASVFRLTTEPSARRQTMLRVVLSGPLGEDVRVSVRLTVGDAAKPELSTELPVVEQVQPNGGGEGKPTRTWYIEYEADAKTAERCRIDLFVATTKGPPVGTSYVIPVKHFLGS